MQNAWMMKRMTLLIKCDELNVKNNCIETFLFNNT